MMKKLVKKGQEGTILNDSDLQRKNWRWAGREELKSDDNLYNTTDDSQKWLVDAAGNLVSKTDVENWVTSYERQTPYQEQNDIAQQGEVNRALQHRLNQEFNRQVDNLFGFNWINPSQIYGAFDFYNENQDVPFSQRLLLGTGNNGVVTSNFAQNHPYWSQAANMAFDVAVPIVGKGVSYVSKPAVLYNIKKFVQHPTYRTYYHGSPEPFPIKNFYRGTQFDIGLHVGDRDIAASMARKDSPYGTGVIYKFRAPRPSAETIDIGSNNYRHLSENMPWEAHPKEGFPSNYFDSYPGDKLKLKLLKENGAEPTLYTPERQNTRLYTENPATLNLRNQFPKIKKYFQKEADAIMDKAKQYEDMGGWEISDWERKFVREAEQINTEAADLLSKAGYKVVKYVNSNPYERIYGTSSTTKPYYNYFITDPSVIQPPFNFPKFNIKIPSTTGITTSISDMLNNSSK